MTYDELKKLFYERLEKNLKVQSLLRKIRDGKADFRDTADYSNLVSSIFSYLMESTVSQMDDPEGTAKKLLLDYYDDLNVVLGETQTALNVRNRIGIKPQKADFPAERVQQFAHSLIDPTVENAVIERRARSGSENIARSLHDDFIEKNAKVRARAGLKVYIVRETDGNCCQWCSGLAGRYVYGQEPHDVFRRHDNCSCVCYKQDGRQKQDVWTKKMLTEVNPTKESKKPTIFTPAQAKAFQEEKLQHIRVDKSGGSGIIKKSGALNPTSIRASEHAAQYYESVRKMTTDVKHISKNTGYSEEFIQSIKDFIFNEKHDLGDRYDYFDPDYKMAQTWQRLIDGKNIQPHDLTLLKHEEMERLLMLKGYS